MTSLLIVKKKNLYKLQDGHLALITHYVTYILAREKSTSKIYKA